MSRCDGAKRPGLTKARRAWLESLRTSKDAVEVLLVTETGLERIDWVEPRPGHPLAWVRGARARLSTAGVLQEARGFQSGAWVEPLTSAARARIHHAARVEALCQRMQTFVRFGGRARVAHLSIARLEQVHAIFDEADALASS